MVEYFFKKYNGKVSKESIKIIYELLSGVNEILPYNDDFEELMNSYLNLELLKIEAQLNRIELDNTIIKLKKAQYNVINKTVISKRENGGLLSYLNGLDDKTLISLNHLVDLDTEYRLVTDKKFWEDKAKRRNKVGAKSFVVGGSDYSLNQEL